MVANCVRCGTEFEKKARSGYVRKTCSHKCAMRFHPPTIERFNRNVNKDAPGGCWLWRGAVNDRGYPNFYEHGKVIRGHRWSYEHFNGPLKPEQVIMHSCDVPHCVTPKHLSAGTLSENSRDCLNKHRRRNLKMNPERVRELRKRIGEGSVEWSVYEEVAKEFKVTACTVYLIHKRRTWKWVA